MNLSRELKKKRDAEKRLEQNSPTIVFSEKVAGEPKYNDFSSLATKRELEDKSNKDHTHNITELVDVSIDYTGNAGKVLKVNNTEDGMELGEGGGTAEIQQATETTLGGIKAKAKTTESSEITIDTQSGKLYGPAPDEAANGIPAGGTTGQVLSKIDGTDYNAQWIDAPSSGGSGVVSGVLLKAEDLIGILVGTGIKSLEDAFISPYMEKALLYKGSDSTTRTDTFMFESGTGKLKIYYEYHTERLAYDWGAFYLDSVQLERFGGTRDVRYLEVDILAGMHEFKIEYRKDHSGAAGYDGIKIYAINYPEP